MLLTLVIVELTLCAPESSIGSFPNFSLIIGDMALLFLRGGACSGTLKKTTSQTTLQKSEKEREAYFSYVSIEMRNFLFQLFANFCFFFLLRTKYPRKIKSFLIVFFLFQYLCRDIALPTSYLGIIFFFKTSREHSYYIQLSYSIHCQIVDRSFACLKNDCRKSLQSKQRCVNLDKCIGNCNGDTQHRSAKYAEIRRY